MESLKVNDTSDKTYIVIGCKRSGTSFLAKALGDQGVDIDTCGNGHNEDKNFVGFNDKILEEAGGDWNNLPHDIRIAKAVEKHRDELRALIKKKKTHMWGWKDPRQGALIKHYLPYLDDDVYLVCVFRRPRRVANSINRIWGTPRQKALEIVKEYSRRTIDAIRDFCNT